jgi:DNA-binding NarL/FixJ family response regulator
MKFALIERKDEFEVLESCRSEVWSYLCQGMTRQDIAIALKVDASTISRDIEHLTLKSSNTDMAKKTGISISLWIAFPHWFESTNMNIASKSLAP